MSERPETMEEAWRRHGEAHRAFWLAVVHALRIDRLLDWGARRPVAFAILLCTVLLAIITAGILTGVEAP